MNRSTRTRHLWRAASGHEQVSRGQPSACTDQPGQFETDECAETVAEKNKRGVQVRQKDFAERLHQWRKPSKRGFREATFPPQQLDAVDLDIGRKSDGPWREYRCATACVWETEEAKTRARIPFVTNDPRISTRHSALHDIA